MNKEIKITETVKIDAGTQVSEKDINALAKMKELEKKKYKRLKKINIAKGYILTNNPDMYKHIK